MDPLSRADVDYCLRVLELDPLLRARVSAFRDGQELLVNDDRDTLRELVGDRLLEVGFDKSYNPTPEGRRLQQLIDLLFTG